MATVDSIQLPTNSLTPYQFNSRTHPKSQIDQLAQAISRFGFTQPIIISSDKTILAGHGRYEAAKKLGLDTVPCRMVDGLTPDEQRAYVIADNKIAEQSDWDHDNLLHELSAIDGLDLGDDLNALLDQTSFVQIKVVQLSTKKLKPHPQNYKTHPEAQIEHLKKSIVDHGIYRNVIVADDYTILAGHGVVQAAIELGLPSVPCLHTSLAPDSIKALKLLTADNEIAHIADSDARELTDILKQIIVDDDLLGTGFDKEKLEALLMVSRSKDEVLNTDEEWDDDLDFSPLDAALKCIVSFEDEKDRASFFNKLGVNYTDKTKKLWWPPKERESHIDKIFVEEEI